MTTPRIVCLGDVMVDVVAELPGPLALGSDVHAPIRYVPGGSAANTAAWLAHIGAKVTLVGRVGDDAMGAQAHRALAEAVIEDRLQTDPDRPTGTCIVLVTPGGERTMIPDPGANAALNADEFDLADFVAGAHLHVSGYALLGGAHAAAMTALARARTAGMTVSVDAASAAPLASTGGASFLSWLGDEVLLFANTAEAFVLTGHSDPAIAVQALARQLGHAVVKAGADGAYWADRGGDAAYAPSLKITAIDTTGAGDAFAAAFLAGRANRSNAEDALRGAGRLAATACGHIGGRPSTDLVTFGEDHRD